ncbi:ArsA family ATPase [Salipaludibacillus aurantiacus]|uniref:Arsenite-transporting ATPase n=1 Tax=Salipaludibacillus aurantiacus TaxID=1601833 RepID=A0A1H9VP63_9BACI|nr:ArsA family ATPase [Salipaludibacillus aurantiacus]SES22993.1 arsenite-transporting ATPase [Salipaludibacillus aurantiacus]
MNQSIERVINKRIIFAGGKGGVGKSTTAASLAKAASDMGKRVLLISTDPAHNLGDIFHTALGNEPITAAEGLDIIEIDPDQETDRYIEQVKENIQGHVKATMIEEVNRQMDLAKSSPGADEAALFHRLASLILEEEQNYDLLVFDTAPTGHTLRLLSLPELMGVWMDGMLERRKKTNEHYTQMIYDGEPVDDPIFQVLQNRRQTFAKVREILLDKEITGFLFVLNPERLPIQETKRAVETLKKNKIPVLAIIINKILPESVDGSFFQKRKEQQKYYLEEIDHHFKGMSKIYVPLLEEDISTLSHLDQIIESMTEK